MQTESQTTHAPLETFDAPRLNSLLLRFLNNLKRNGKSAHTLSAYRNDVGLFCEFLLTTGFHPGDWTGRLKDAWVEFLHNKGRHSDASVRRALMSVRTFLHFLINEKAIESSSLLESKSPRQPTHDLLTVLPEHFRLLVTNLRRKANAGDEKAIRDFAIFLLLGKCGLKATEAANVTWGDVSFSGGKKGGGTLVVRGPGERILPLDPDTALCLQRLRDIRKTLELSTDIRSKLFFGYLNLSRKTRTNFLHRHGIKFVIYEVSNEILGTAYNSESLRNYAIATWISKGMNAQQVASLAGYSSLNSLERFSLDVRKLRLPKRHITKSERH
jgi:site-specific recombinase XerD